MPLAGLLRAQLLTVLICLYALVSYAQFPALTPKTPPIILKLDDQGKHKVVVDSLAAVYNPTDSVMKFKFKPASFDCSTTGKNTVNVVGFTNGGIEKTNSGALGYKSFGGLVYDQSGNLFSGDSGIGIMRKFEPNGHFSFFAGDGLPDARNGQGRSAGLGISSPGGMVCDSLGNLFFADSQNKLIRKLDKYGTVSTYAGTGQAFVKDGDAQSASFYYPGLLTMDKTGNMYVSEGTYNYIRKISPEGNVTTLRNKEGFIIAMEGSISGLSLDNQGNLYVCARRGPTVQDEVFVKKITPLGEVSIFFDPHTYSSQNNDFTTIYHAQPECTLFLPNGDLIYGGFGELTKVSKNGTATIIAGSRSVGGSVDGRGSAARFTLISYVTRDICGNFIVVDGNYIRKVTIDGLVTTLIGGLNPPVDEGNIGTNSCQVVSADVPVKVQSVPKFINTFSDLTLNDCANLANYTTKANTANNCPDNNVTVTQTPAPNSPVFNNVPVKVTLTATDTTGGTATTSFVVTARYSGSLPGRSVSVSASKTAICAGEPVTFTATLINPDANPNYQWLVNGFSVGSNQPTFSTGNLANGDVINCAVTTGNGCGIPNTGLPVAMSVDSLPVVTLAKQESVIAGSGVTLKPIVNGKVVNYLWSPAAGLNDINSPSPIASPNQTTTYTL
ncbi:NHL repeat-containing protein [Mucilaginibacter ginkgonis]|uniref:Ig-like domain-containing protein n=1 Tax=Mucilaginibacter ginkgonis TaxID=2682091 RepID=A0A6I4IP01_9SPHI|nr:hypothetical protein [Mucilaginibacter ginkgonis]QQL50661.1 hypothetical protein GO620_004165 [Mucilaginibacter ginkgonis]